MQLSWAVYRRPRSPRGPATDRSGRKSAPSACNEQVVSFIVVDDPSLLAQIAEIVDKPVCRGAKAMIACVADPRPVYAGLSFAREDAAAAVENMLLAITALGYATVWLDGILRTEERAAASGDCSTFPATRRFAFCCRSACRPNHAGSVRSCRWSRAWFNRFGG